MIDDCPGCAALGAEAGDRAEHYARRLPVRGWAGTLSDSERLYLRHHTPEWYRLALARTPGTASKAREQAASDRDHFYEEVASEEAA